MDSPTTQIFRGWCTSEMNKHIHVNMNLHRDKPFHGIKILKLGTLNIITVTVLKLTSLVLQYSNASKYADGMANT